MQGARKHVEVLKSALEGIKMYKKVLKNTRIYTKLQGKKG